MEEIQNTEAVILKAAQKVFIEKGFDGATMKRIADESGTNKALLHYYFRNKEKLFEAAFQKVFSEFITPMISTMASDINITEKIDGFVSLYIETIRKNPLIPLFILHELRRDPENLKSIVLGTGIQPKLIIGLFQREMDQGNIRKMDPHQLLINILSLCVFPFAAEPLLKGVFFENDSRELEVFWNKRAAEVSAFINQAIQAS